jgi:hypothetical protein
VEIANLSSGPLEREATFLATARSWSRTGSVPSRRLPRQIPSSDWHRRLDSTAELAQVCGLRLRVRHETPPVIRTPKDLGSDRWDKVAESLRANKGGLGDLDGGNHFLDTIVPYDDRPLHFLIHTGSRDVSGHVVGFIDAPSKFDQEFERVVSWAADNRAAINDSVDRVFGPTEVILDLPHNTFEQLEDGGVVIRKSSVRMLPGDLSVLPPHMSGDCGSRQGENEGLGNPEFNEPRNRTCDVEKRLQTSCGQL